MPKMHVSKSITIDAPTHRVFSIINNFHHWSIWSPWLVAEPESQLHVREDGKFYAWEGKRVGAGEMTIIDENPETTVDYDLTFLKPWKSTAKVRFLIEPVSQKTKVTWLMDSRLPFFLFWMKKSMEAFVGMDFTRGLNMLKEYIETGKVSSELNFIGQSLYPGSKYFGITTESTISRVGADMQEDFKKIGAFLQDKGIKPAHQLFSMYRKWDMVKDKVIYTAGVPVNEIPADLPSSFVSGEIPKTKVYTLRHIGSYLHLGNAWTTLNMMQRNKEFKNRKDIFPFECYVNMPGEVPNEELITDIHFPVKE